MFIGHYAVGLAAKRAAPRASLGWLIGAALLVDLLWPIFLLLGWERVRIDPGNTAFTPLAFDFYPFTHSLAATLGWAVLFGIVYFAVGRTVRGAVVVGGLVVSHWLLDAASHRPDLPLYPGGTTLVGLGLWNSVTGTFVTEGILFAAGVWVYLSFTRGRDRVGRYGFPAFVLVVLLMYLGAALGPPPPSVEALAWVSIGGCLVPLWAAWLDRHRAVRSAGGGAWAT